MQHILKAVPFALPYILLIFLVVASHEGGWVIFIPFWVWVTMGDLAFGLRTTNLDSSTPERELWAYNLLLWLWVPCQIGVSIYVFWQIHISGHLSTGESIALTVILGKVAAHTIATGHELIHRPAKWERGLGEVLLSSIAFAHYQTEHVFIHHRHVGTPTDPVFAAKGQSFWSYILWSLFGNLLMTWRVECDRLARLGLPAWHPTNPFWRYNLLTAAWVALYAWMGGWFGVGLYLLYSLIAMTLLRSIDYVEHYGLSRQLLPSGRYERTQPRHSWNASHRVSNWVSWNVQRHSDHHRVAVRPYPLLQHFNEDTAPQLPYNYTVMFVCALIPPLWFRIVDPRIDAWRERFYPAVEPASWRAYESKLYRTRPRQLTLITEIMETSARWSRWAEKHPSLLNSLEDSAFTNLHIPDDLGLDEETLKIARRGLVRLFYSQEFKATELKSIIAESDSAVDLDYVLDEARSWMNARVFQIGMHMFRGNLEPWRSQATFADMIDTLIGVVVDAAAEEFTAKVGTPPSGQFAVVACNRLGRRDVEVEGELELLYLYDSQPDAPGGENGSINGMTPGHYYDRLSTQCMKSFRSLTRENMLFGSVNAPNGMFSNNGTAVSLTDLREHWQVRASLQDSLALAQARVIYGDESIVQGFQQVKREVLAALRERVQSGSELASLRAGLTAPPPHPQVPLPRNTRGGLDDLDRVASYLKVMHGSECDGLLGLDTSAVFEQLSGAGLIDAEIARELADASSLLRNIEVIWHMTVRDRAHDTEVTKAMERTICLACEQESMSSLARHARATADRAAERIESLLAAA